MENKLREHPDRYRKNYYNNYYNWKRTAETREERFKTNPANLRKIFSDDCKRKENIK